MLQPDDILATLARDMRIIRRTYGATSGEILARLDGSPQLFDVLNVWVQWNGWSQRELSDFECACFGIVTLHVDAINYSTENFLFGDAANDAPAMGKLLEAASPPLADHFGQLLDIVPGYREARNHEERQRAFATEDEDLDDLWHERISAWQRSYISKPYVSDRDLLRHVALEFRDCVIIWPPE